jgi:hypothetical protein
MVLTSQITQELLARQLKTWDQARSNYEALSKVEVKEFTINGFTLRVQFNPGRIQSSAAKVDAKSISERKCFLCPQNLPVAQEGIPFGDEYQLLVNPFPIFPQHFTIPSYKHVDQLIIDRYGDMLDLAKALDELVIFYNGPKCGASAPDHAHFQAGNKGFLPIEKDIHKIDKELLLKAEEAILYASRDYLCNYLHIRSSSREKALFLFKEIYDLLEIKEGDNEPMMNILTWYEGDVWNSCIFPREKHRPDCYFAEGEKNILISPASVDLGGVFITPLEKDFVKVTGDDLHQILKEVCISDAKMNNIINKIKK